MDELAPCPAVAHDLYSCPRWLGMLASDGRGAEQIVTAGESRLPLHESVKTGSRRYSAAHLFRDLTQCPARPLLGGPASGYRTAFERELSGSSSIFRQLGAVASDAGQVVVVPFLPADALPTAADGGVLLHEEVECWMRPASEPQALINSLPNDRRRDLSMKYDVFKESGLRVAALPLTPARCSQFGVLASLSAAKYGSKGDPAGLGEHLMQIARHIGRDAQLVAALDGEVLVGGVLMILHRRRLFVRFVGFDYERTAGTFAYFVLMFLAPTLLRNDLGDFDDVHLGVGALSTKLRYGARARPLSTWIMDPEGRLTQQEVSLANQFRIEASYEMAGGARRRAEVARSVQSGWPQGFARQAPAAGWSAL